MGLFPFLVSLFFKTICFWRNPLEIAAFYPKKQSLIAKIQKNGKLRKQMKQKENGRKQELLADKRNYSELHRGNGCTIMS